jgi:uncharacterized protein YkwD
VYRGRATPLLLAALLSGCAAADGVRAPTAAPVWPAQACAPAEATSDALEEKVMAETNAFRRQNRLAPLAPGKQLIALAQTHARNMARQDKFGDGDKNGHILDGRGFEERIRASGYPFARVAENVGYQLNKPDAAAAMMAAWKKSTGHRRNMLIPEITEIGVGAAHGRSGRWYFVQIFGRPQQQAPVAP